MTEPQKIDPFLEFIREHRCTRKGCGFTDPFLHTHYLYELHRNAVPSACPLHHAELHHQWTARIIQFNQAGIYHMSQFECEKGKYLLNNEEFPVCLRIITPAQDWDSPEIDLKEMPRYVKVVYMPSEDENNRCVLN